MITNTFTVNEYRVVELNDQVHSRIKVEPMYFKLGFSPSPLVFGRFVILNRLLKALDLLPPDYGFLIWDVYRPRIVQKKLFEWMKTEIQKKFPDFNEKEIEQETGKYIAAPSAVGEEYCPPHLSGGAIDLTLYDLSTGQGIEMGTGFDDFSERAHRDYFLTQTQSSLDELNIQKNRQLLRSAMEMVGFASYQYEWWHFDIGNQCWSQTIQSPAVFGPLFGDKEWPETHEISIPERSQKTR